MQIAQYADRRPDKLSGGHNNALARALAVNPSVLLMDEPLSNLDAKLRLDMRQAIREIQTRSGNYNRLCNPRPRRSYGYFRSNYC